MLYQDIISPSRFQTAICCLVVGAITLFLYLRCTHNPTTTQSPTTTKTAKSSDGKSFISRNGLHKVTTDASLMRSPCIRPMQQNNNKVDLKRPTQAKDNRLVIRVVLTGGPCGGKSSALERLTKDAKAAGFDVLIAPETPTILFNSGVYLPLPGTPENPELLQKFQAGILDLQLQLERTMTNIANKTGRPTILILDRGMMDGKAFCSPTQWTNALNEDSPVRSTPLTEQYILQRYDAIIHLETCAAKEETKQYYKQVLLIQANGHKVLRRETPEQSHEADKKLFKAYSNHTKHVYVPCGGSFDDKLDLVSTAVLEVAQAKYPLRRINKLYTTSE